ncbi:MAG: hypothetical protein NXI31_06805 [bacterium]|nr:hypothetical protein [bacterium]
MSSTRSTGPSMWGRMPSCLVRLFGAALFVVATAVAQVQNDRESTVGMRARIHELVLPGSEVTVKPTGHDTPVVVRITAKRPHGDAFRYDLEWVALEVGSHDLRDYLARKDGSPLEGLPELTVEVAAVRPADQTEPVDPTPIRPENTGGYTVQLVVATVIWIIGLLAILFVGRKRKAVARATEAPPTLADRLQPFVAAAADGSATDAEKAELERLLVAFWRERLELEGLKADRAIAKIREHDEAGQLVRQLEAWLHMPEPPQAVDVEGLLAPYRSVSAAEFDESRVGVAAGAATGVGGRRA